MRVSSSSHEKLEGTFAAARDLVAEKRPEVLEVTVYVGCPEVERWHRSDPRGYMHVGHRRGQICVAAAAGDLDRRTLLGLWLHELGHMVGGPEQFDADIAIFELLGIPIMYDERSLQYVEL